MDWFNILKNPELVQRQRQGMKPIDIQKPFKRVKEEDNCFEKLKAFFNSRVNSPMDEHEGMLIWQTPSYDDFGIINDFHPDEYYCRTMKWIEEKLANHDKNVDHRFEDSDLSYRFTSNYTYGHFSAYVGEKNGHAVALLGCDFKEDEMK
tara:strand:+ start:379 stop:825 length:447 start_codon:yes stop_codon:yes gene_type:complete